MTASSNFGYRPCAGVMLLNRAGLAWIGRRHGSPSEPEGPDQWWQMPQGGIDGGEEPLRAALRELREETGVTSVRVLGETQNWLTYDLPPELQGKAWGGRYKGQKQKWFAMRFLGADSEIDIAPRDGHAAEFDAWTWAKAADLPGLIVPFKRAVYAAVVDELGPLARPDLSEA